MSETSARGATHRTVTLGLPPPLGYVVDNKAIYPHYQDDSRFGACLHFVGQETCFEDWEDEDLLRASLTAVRRVEGFEDLDREGVVEFSRVGNMKGVRSTLAGYRPPRSTPPLLGARTEIAATTGRNGPRRHPSSALSEPAALP